MTPTSISDDFYGCKNPILWMQSSRNVTKEDKSKDIQEENEEIVVNETK